MENIRNFSCMYDKTQSAGHLLQMTFWVSLCAHWPIVLKKSMVKKYFLFQMLNKSIVFCFIYILVWCILTV